MLKRYTSMCVLLLLVAAVRTVFSDGNGYMATGPLYCFNDSKTVADSAVSSGNMLHSNDSLEPVDYPVYDDTDSTRLLYESSLSLYQTFKTRNRLVWTQLLPQGAFEQSADYRFVQLNSRSKIHSVNMSGKVMRYDFLFDGFDAGLDWNPILLYNRRTGGSVQSSIDVGPVINHSILSLPYKVRGGLYYYGWRDSIYDLSETPLNSFNGEPGVYGGCSIGDTTMELFSMPLYAYIDAQGRSIHGSSVGVFKGFVRYRDALPFGGRRDSFYVHVGDSITNGKELYIGEYGGTSLYSNSSWRINHSFSGIAGIEGDQRFGIRPSAYFRYYANSIAYPSKSNSLDDIKTTGQTLGAGVVAGEEFPLTYYGGIEFTWEYEDWLYRHRFRNNISLTAKNRDSLIVNQSDHYSDMTHMNNELRLALPWHLSAVYTLVASKDSKKYPFKYIDLSSMDRSKTNQNENDRVQIDHKLSLRCGNDSARFIETYGTYGKGYHYYYREQRSAESRKIWEYRIGINGAFSLGPVYLRQQLYADAEISDYYFKEVDGEPVKAPPYSRDLVSSLGIKVKMCDDRVHLNAKWVEMYNDNGVWYGEKYWPDSVSFDHEYYAIERKGTQYWIDFFLDYTPIEGAVFAGGCIFRDIMQRRFNTESRTYVVSDFDLGYGIEPYILAQCPTELCFIKLKLKRIFNTRDDERWNLKKNWDLSLNLQMVF